MMTSITRSGFYAEIAEQPDVLLRCAELAERVGELAVALDRLLLGALALGDLALQTGVRLLHRGGALLHAQFEIFVGSLKRELPAFALDGVSHRAGEQMVVNVSFYEVVLRSEMNGFDGDGGVIDPAEDDDRKVGRAFVDADESLDPVAVRERQVEQDQTDPTALQLLHPGSE